MSRSTPEDVEKLDITAKIRILGRMGLVNIPQDLESKSFDELNVLYDFLLVCYVKQERIRQMHELVCCEKLIASEMTNRLNDEDLYIPDEAETTIEQLDEKIERIKGHIREYYWENVKPDRQTEKAFEIFYVCSVTRQ